ncbi:MAG TPA: LysR family transcriptional regulator [Casimicrobiaceae bacterium]|nr:LysR family transcriptional regulator [Casimicrobiaceae bacterium]
MNVDMRQLRAFSAIGRLASFTKAAAALHTTQPALSAQIRHLEDALDLKLFDRSTRAVTLTQAGRDLLPVVDRVLADVSAVIAQARDVAHMNTGRVSVAALPSVSSTLLPQAMAELKARHPGVTVVLKDALAERIVAMVRGGAVDFGLTGEPGADAQLEFTPLATDHMVIVMPRGHPFSRMRRLRLDDLLDAPLILMDRDSSVRRIVDGAYAAAGIASIAPAYEAAFMATAIAMVRGGLGITLLPSSAIELTSAHDLATRAIADPRLTRTLGILRERRRSLSPAAQSFADLLVKRVPTWFATQSRLGPARRRRKTRAVDV